MVDKKNNADLDYELNFEAESLMSLSKNFKFIVALGLYVILFLVLGFLLITQKAEAKVIVYGNTAEQIRIVYGGPTIFRFQKAVQTITGAGRFSIKPANANDPSYTVLAVTPHFTNGVNDVLFFLTDKSVVRTKIVVSPSDPAADSYYDFKSRESGDVGETENAPPITEVELLKALVRDDTVAGYKIHKVAQIFPSKNSDAKAELIRIYRGTPFNGYVFKLTNTSWKKNVEVDVRHIAVGEPNLAILSQSDETTLYPKGKGPDSTLIRVVAKNTASSSDVILAMESDEKASDSKKGE